MVFSLHLHVFKLPEAAHGLHLLQVTVEGQSAQAKAVAAVAYGLQSLHLFNNGGHGYRWWHRRRGRFLIVLSSNRLVTWSLFVWPEITQRHSCFKNLYLHTTPPNHHSVWTQKYSQLSFKKKKNLNVRITTQLSYFLI